MDVLLSEYSRRRRSARKGAAPTCAGHIRDAERAAVRAGRRGVPPNAHPQGRADVPPRPSHKVLKPEAGSCPGCRVSARDIGSGISAWPRTGFPSQARWQAHGSRDTVAYVRMVLQLQPDSTILVVTQPARSPFPRRWRTWSDRPSGPHRASRRALRHPRSARVAGRTQPSSHIPRSRNVPCADTGR